MLCQVNCVILAVHCSLSLGLEAQSLCLRVGLETCSLGHGPFSLICILKLSVLKPSPVKWQLRYAFIFVGKCIQTDTCYMFKMQDTERPTAAE